jgi:hypothetical protein
MLLDVSADSMAVEGDWGNPGSAIICLIKKEDTRRSSGTRLSSPET